MTDVTGFGLLGHLIEMAEGAGLNAELYYDNIPVLDGVRDYLKERIVPDATYRNWNSYSAMVGFDKGVNVMEAFNLLPDPQTNGGLLIAVAPEALAEVQGMGVDVAVVGRFVEKEKQSGEREGEVQKEKQKEKEKGKVVLVKMQA